MRKIIDDEFRSGDEDVDERGDDWALQIPAENAGGSHHLIDPSYRC